MVIVRNKNKKLRVCIEGNIILGLKNISIFFMEVGGHARYTFMERYADYKYIYIYSINRIAQNGIYYSMGNLYLVGNAFWTL